MPKAFDNCRKGGGRIRTVTGPGEKFGVKLGSDEFVHVCFDKSGAHPGHKKKRRSVSDAVEKGTSSS